MRSPQTLSSAPLLAVDGHALLWRATFGFPSQVYSRDKTRTLTGVFGFFALLRAAIRHELSVAPEVIVAFDGEYGVARRRSDDIGYKAQRAIDGDALAPIGHLPDVKRGLDTLDISWIEIDDAEADDVIATLVAQTDPGRRVCIMSGDRDFYQLVDDRIHVLNTAMRPGRRLVGAAEVVNRYGVQPSQWCCYRALCGDSADNITGVRGVGPKTAAGLLAGGLGLEDLPVSGRLDTHRGGAAVRGCWQQVLTWRRMIRLVTDLPLPAKSTGEPTPPLPPAADILGRLDLW